MSSKRYDIYRDLDLDETGILVLGRPGTVYGWAITNDSASVSFVKLYDKVTAPTVGTDTPAMTIQIPAATYISEEFLGGIYFPIGVGIGATTGVADGNTGAPAANDLVVNLFYKEG